VVTFLGFATVINKETLEVPTVDKKLVGKLEESQEIFSSSPWKPLTGNVVGNL